MKPAHRALLILACSSALTTPAWAQVEPNGFYVAGDLGVHQDESKQAESSLKKPDGFTAKWDFAIDEDYAAFGRLGYRISPNWRVEAEGGYRFNNQDGAKGVELASVQGFQAGGDPTGLCRFGVVRTAAAPTCLAPSGSIRVASAMINVIYDLFPDSTVRPFIGAGIGATQSRVNVLGQFNEVPPGFAPYQNLRVSKEKDVSLAYQALGGLTWSVTPRLAIDGTYRAIWSEHEFESTTFAGTTAPLIQLGTFEREYFDQSVTLGVRYNFGPIAAPPLPPPPEPAPLPVPPPQPVPTPEPVAQTPVPQEFVVYFPFDQYVLTPEAQGVIQQAAAYAQQGAPTSIVVVGHADTSGSQAYNVRLSERRSKAVADSLVGLGVAQTALQVDWRGETQPAVPTGDGVKEPLNRRTTIGINF
jgi:outer membrane protein OmpA-like peptidoglycan-associated protein/outer membrane protein W